ncbi:recombination-associated protein RdgC [Rubrivivax gelatinosus]|uniref:recombination-associated protein RdgC n=1 Tax=Rubrivivax gelatinosus TaxID=28068 RepID=UPI0003126169|nr:recombination-associated protein RdgC [Rubrivivax gelatinosus]MBG6083108.1 recombination associated protein RdgC [Rubrivivax gelatinosus]
MFKNLTALRIQNDWRISHSAAEAAADALRFNECGATQAVSAGWVVPRGVQHGPLVETVGDQWLMSLCIQTKLLPAAVVKRHVEKRIEDIKARDGRKPGKREVLEIKQAVLLELLPKAFSKMEFISIWIDRKGKTVVIDTTSNAKTDLTISALIETFNTAAALALVPINTEQSPSACMSAWLLDGDAPANFTVDSECELKSTDERRSAVRYSRHTLDIDEIKQHIQQGKTPTQLAMTWNSRVSFVLTATMALKKVTFLETPLLKKGQGDEEPFDSNAAIVTGELSQLLPHLIEALGGEAELRPSRTDQEEGAEGTASAEELAEA